MATSNHFQPCLAPASLPRAPGDLEQGTGAARGAVVTSTALMSSRGWTWPLGALPGTTQERPRASAWRSRAAVGGLHRQAAEGQRLGAAALRLPQAPDPLSAAPHPAWASVSRGALSSLAFSWRLLFSQLVSFRSLFKFFINKLINFCGSGDEPKVWCSWASAHHWATLSALVSALPPATPTPGRHPITAQLWTTLGLAPPLASPDWPCLFPLCHTHCPCHLPASSLMGKLKPSEAADDARPRSRQWQPPLPTHWDPCVPSLRHVGLASLSPLSIWAGLLPPSSPVTLWGA